MAKNKWESTPNHWSAPPIYNIYTRQYATMEYSCAHSYRSASLFLSIHSKFRPVITPGMFAFFKSATAFESIGNNPLELSVYTSKLIVSPFFQGLHSIRINPQYKTLCRTFFCHNTLVINFDITPIIGPL